MGECNGRAWIGREGPFVLILPPSTHTHVHAYTDTLIYTNTLTLFLSNMPFFIIPTHKHKHITLVCTYMWASENVCSHTVMLMQKILTCCFPVGYVTINLLALPICVCVCVCVCRSINVADWKLRKRAGSASWSTVLMIMMMVMKTCLAKSCYIALLPLSLRFPMAWMGWQVQ